jgi:hypothetical protein
MSGDRVAKAAAMSPALNASKKRLTMSALSWALLIAHPQFGLNSGGDAPRSPAMSGDMMAGRGGGQYPWARLLLRPRQHFHC